jgi:hypothetical protein
MKLSGVFLFAVVLQLTFVYETFAQAANRLTSKEKDGGWALLFDGKSFKGWRMLAGDGWLIKDGELTAIPASSPKQSDIIVENQYGNFELVFDFKMSEKTNSGLKYLVTNNFPEQKGAYLGLEYQIVDEVNFIYPERGALRTLGALYDLIPADTIKVTSPLGSWNTAKIVVDGNHIQHWLNGKKVVEYDRSTAGFANLIADSKYKSLAGFGKAAKGHLLFQNEGSPIAFKNIKIRRLAAGKPVL